jgi:drug/metabolite transporter (DMT)-like permease
MLPITNKKFSWFTAGILFALLWASAATATKIGLSVAQPLMIAVVRFGVAAMVMLFMAHVIKSQRFPRRKEWAQLVLYGILNISVYLGCYVIALRNVTAGIGALAVATNPVFISFLSLFFLKKKPVFSVLLSIAICALGVVCAAWPLLGNATINGQGLLILLFSMLSYSIGAIYFSSREWGSLSLLTINGWQTLLGGLFLLPVAIFFYSSSKNHYDGNFWLSVIWLAIPVSVFAVQLWLWLLQVNAVRAGLWLFLCPLFGFAFSSWFLNDVISAYTIAGVLLVLAGLWLSQINTKKNEVVFD